MSRPRSGRTSATPVARTGSQRAAGGRTTGGRPGVFVQTPKSDIYVTMLGIALGAMFLGSILLVLILARYDFKVKAAALPASAATVA
jgi:hypothetical protein